MYAIAVVLLNALSFASLAYIANRKGYHAMAALAAAGAWRRADLGGLALMSRRFPPPRTAEETDACFIVKDHAGLSLAYVYFEEELSRTSAHSGRGAAHRREHCKAA
jgi:hypothetical protein